MGIVQVPRGQCSAPPQGECECRDTSAVGSWLVVFAGWQLAFGFRWLAVGGQENALVGSWLVVYVMGPVVVGTPPGRGGGPWPSANCAERW